MVSVIIPSYNQLEGLKTTLAAFEKFRGLDLEIIVVDGDSSDGSKEWLEENSSKIDKVLIEPDKGIYDAMNKGVGLCKGDWVWFMGTGDLPLEDGVKEMVSALGETSFKMLAFGVHLLPPREPGVPEFYRPYWGRWLVWRNTIHHQGAVYSRELLDRESYDLRFKVLADYHLNLKLWKKGVEGSSSPTIIAEVAPGGVSRNFSHELYSEERYLKKDVLTPWENISQGIFTRIKWLWKKVR